MYIFIIIIFEMKIMLKNLINTTLIMILFYSVSLYSQYKDNNLIKKSISDGIVVNQNNYIFGIFNPENFNMNHIYNLSFSTSGSNQLAVGSYTNRIFYKFNDKMNFQLWTSLVTTPYSTLNNSNDKFDGIYIDKASINYSPSNNFMIELQFSNNPYRYYQPYYNYNRFSNYNYGYDFNTFIY